MKQSDFLTGRHAAEPCLPTQRVGTKAVQESGRMVSGSKTNTMTRNEVLEAVLAIKHEIDMFGMATMRMIVR